MLRVRCQSRAAIPGVPRAIRRYALAMAKKTAKKSPRKRPSKKDSAGDVTTLPRLPLPPVIPLGSVLGQARAMSVIDRALASERVHHAWLFHGPPGVGKCTAALAFAAALLDPEAGPGLTGAFETDPDSRVQRMVREGSHPELHVIRKELASFHPETSVRDSKQQAISVKVTRHFLIEPATRTAAIPGGLASKVFVVDEAELLNTQSQNAILKTLEEPPEGTVLILVTSSEDRLLPTIRSRCQRVGFTPLDDGDMATWLDGWCRVRNLELDPAHRDWLLEFSAGSPGQLETAHDDGLHAWWDRIEPMLDRLSGGQPSPALGTAMTELVDAWASEWAKGGEKGLEQRSKNVANRLAFRRMLSLVAHHARARLGSDRTRAWGGNAIEAVTRADALFARSVQPGFVFEGLAADLASPEPVVQ